MIWKTSSKKGRHYSSDSFSDKSESESLLARYSSWDTYRRPAALKEMNKLDHVVTNNLNTNKDQLNEATKNDLAFHTSSFNLSSGNSDPFPVVTGNTEQKLFLV